MRQGKVVSDLASPRGRPADPADRALDAARRSRPIRRARSRCIVTVWGDALAPHGGAAWLAGLIRPDGAVRHQRAAGAHQRVPAGARRLAVRDARRPQEPLPPDAVDGARRFDDAYRRIYDRPPRSGMASGSWCWRTRVARRPPRRTLRDELAWAGFGDVRARRRTLRPATRPRARAVGPRHRAGRRPHVVARSRIDLPGHAVARGGRGARVGRWPRSPATTGASCALRRR